MYIEQQPSMNAAHLETLTVKAASSSLRNGMQDKWGDMVNVETGTSLNSITMSMDVLPSNVQRVMSEIRALEAT